MLSVSTDPASNATLVQSWNPHTGGFLNWAHHQSPSSSSTTARSSYTNLCTLPSTGSSALLSDNRVILLRSDGVVEWRWRLEEDDKNDIASSTSTSTTTTATTFRLLSCTSDSVYVTGVTSDGQVMAVSISLTTGKSVAKRFGTDRLVNDKENNRNSDDDLFVLDAVDAIVWNAENGRLCSMDLSLLEKMDDYVPSSTCSHVKRRQTKFNLILEIHVYSLCSLN